MAVTALILTAQGVFAQTTSNTRNATADLYKSDVDKAQDVHDWSTVKFDKWFGFAGYGTGPINLGYATTLGSGLYLGAFYQGNVVSIESNQDEEVRTTWDLDDGVKDSTVTITNYGPDVVTYRNALQVLIGINNMGFRVGFAENLTDTSYPNTNITVTENRDGTVQHGAGEIVEYSSLVGSLTPSLRWGMVMDLASGAKLKPFVEAGVVIGLDSVVNDFRAGFTTVAGDRYGQSVINHEGNNSGYLRPGVSVGTALEFDNKRLDVSYGIGMGLYNNDYDVAGFSGSVPGTVSWGDGGNSVTRTTTSDDTTVKNNDAGLTINEYNSDFVHTIALAFTVKWAEIAEGLNLGFKVGATGSIQTSNRDTYNLALGKTETVYNNSALSGNNAKTVIETRTFGTTTDLTSWSVTPYCNLGAQYVVVADRFSVNAGVRLYPVVYSSTVTRTSVTAGSVRTEKTYNPKGEVVSKTVTVYGGEQVTDTVVVDNIFTRLRAGFAGGFVFSFTDTLALDTAFTWNNSAANPQNDFEVDVAALSVLLSFKF